MAQLSLVLEAFRKQQGQKYQSGRGVRSSAQQPAAGGTARGAMGVLGSRAFQSRNSDAGMDRERKRLMEHPVMQAFTQHRQQRLLF